MKLTRVSVSLLFLLLFCASFAHAQRLGSLYFGVGSATDSASKNSGIVSLISPDKPPSLGGVFGDIGGGIMLSPKYGVGGEIAFRFNQGDYSPTNGLKYRPIFYDFNGIWEPSGSSGKVVPELQAGLGGANLKLYLAQSSSSPLFGSQNYTQLLSSQNFFQLHAAAAVRFYVTDNVFVRPAFDYHWVHGFTQFGGSSVLQFTGSIGYTFGQP